MFRILSEHLKDVSVLRRLLFAATHLPREVPNHLGVAVEFATCGKVERNCITEDLARVIVENIECFDSTAFATDDHLLKQLIAFKPSNSRPLGIVLISPEESCTLCGEKLSLRKDRPALLVIYDDHLGAVAGSHFHKYCSSRTCTLTQYYGYYTVGGDSSRVLYNSGWKCLLYFVSSRETAFSMSMLQRLDSEVLIGQLSYKQRADIFNDVHSCNMMLDVSSK